MRRLRPPVRLVLAFACAALTAAVAVVREVPLHAQASSQGQWSAPFPMPLVAVHAALMHSGQVLMFDAWEIPGTPSARLWDPATNTYAAVPNGFAELFCSGHVLADDGRLITSGGHNGAGVGTTDATAFDANTRLWTALPNLTYARWYPAMTQLADGRFLTMGGAISRPDIAEIPEAHLAGAAAWVPMSGAQKDLGEYPVAFQAPNGRVFVNGMDASYQSWMLDVAAQTWTPLGQGPAEAGAGVMYRPGKVMMSGGGVQGGDPVSADTGVIDLTAPVPAWRATAPMTRGRFLHNLVILPDGKVLAVGGSTVVSLTSTTGVLPAEVWDPDTETWTALAPMQTPRLYHSTALLLPDGRVLAAGGGRLAPAIDHLDGELFSPPYLAAGARPVVTAAPASATYGSSFTVDTPDAATVTRVTLVRTSSVTHAVNYDQRFYEASFSRTGSGLVVQAPPDATQAPPGYYLLFALNANGVPSLGRMVRIQGPPSGPALTVSDVNVVEGTGGTKTASFAVTLTGAPSQAVAVDYLTVDGTARAGSDYTATTGRLTFAPGVTTQAVTVPITTDSAVEGNEGFTLVITNASGATITDAVGAAVIIDDDVPASPTLYIDSVRVTEGTGTGTPVAAFTVTLQPAAAQDVLVRFRTVPGTALSPDDYQATSGTLTFAGGSTVQTIQVPIVPDGAGEPDETFTVELYEPTNAQLGTAVGTGTIVNDDTVTATFAIASGGDDVQEDGPTFDANGSTGWLGTGGSATASYAGLRFTNVGIPAGATINEAHLDVRASSSQWVPLTFDYGIDAALDSLPFSDATRPSQRTLLGTHATHASDAPWTAGTRYALDDIKALVQAAVSRPGWAPGKPLTLVLKGAGASWARKFTSAFESGAAQAPRLVVTYTVAVGNRAPVISQVTGTPTTGPAPLAVLFSAAASDPDGQPLTYTWAFGDGATAVGQATPHTYTAAGQYSATVTVSDGTAQAVSAPIVIQAGGTVTPTLSIADASVLEGNGGIATAAVTVSLSAAAGTTPVTVTYATRDGSATAPGDYVPTTGTLTFSGATTSQTILLDVLGDAAVEPDETFAVDLSNASGATLGRASATVTIANDDLPALSVADTTIAEGSTGTSTAIVTVSLSAPSTSPVTVAYATSAGTAQAPGDFTAAAGSLTFSPGSSTRTIQVPIVADQITEPDETFTVTLGSPVGATLGRATATVTILNDDTGTGPITSTFQVAAGSDDVNQDGTAFTADGSSVWLGTGATAGAGYAGLRFIGVAVPRGAQVAAAWLEVNAAATQWLSLDLDIAADASASAAPFTATALPSARALLAPHAQHVSDAQWVAGTWYPLADVAPLLQAAVDQPGWQAGNAVALVLRGNGQAWARKFIAAVEGAPALAPRLVVTYTQGAATGPAVSIGPAAVAEGNASLATLSFDVTLSAPAAQTVTVAYTTSGGTATAGTDFTAAAGTVTFAPGVVSQTVAVDVLGDTLDEDDETITVGLASPVNAVLGTTSAVGTIVDDDPAPMMSVAGVRVIEGQAGTTTAAFAVTLSAPSGRPVSAAYATGGGTATAEVDYTAASGTVTFAPGVTSQVIAVAVTGDTVSEPDETFGLTLSNPAAATLGAAVATATIADDDGLPGLSINAVSVTEGNTGSVAARFTVSLSTASAEAVSVAYGTTAGTATEGADYSAVAGVLTIPAGALSRTIDVPVLGDVLDENDETFAVVLSAPTGATLVTATGTGTVVDNDATPSLVITDVRITEGGAGAVTPAVFTVTLSAPSGRTVTVNAATANSTATTAGGDYTAWSGSLSFAPGVTTQQVSANVLGDARDEADETFFVNLSGAVNATIADTRGIATIVDDDPLPQVLVADAAVLEGNTGTKAMVFTVTLSEASNRTVSITYATTDGTATAGSDYTAKSGTLTIAAGATSGTISVTVTGDRVVEPDETLFLNLTGISNGTLLRTQAVGTILTDGT